jgi:hypothetical protein
MLNPVPGVAEAVTVTVPDNVAPDVGEVIETVVGAAALFTVTLTGAEVTLLFPESVATAVSVCGPLAKAAVLRTRVYGMLVTAEPCATPSTRNCTRLMTNPDPAFATADRVTLPDRVTPETGEVMATVVEVLLTVMLTGADVLLPPLESVASAVSVCAPLANVAVFRLVLKGPVSGPPRFTLSMLNCTLERVSPALADATADTVTVPDTVEPVAGAVMVTLGGAALDDPL